MESLDGIGSRGGVKFASTKDDEERAWYKRRVGFLLYIKLSTLIGLTWAFGLVASILDMPSLWYPFIILNSLQGLFIFVLFTEIFVSLRCGLHCPFRSYQLLRPALTHLLHHR